MATFAERLRSLRQEKGWSQQRLADNLKLSKSSVNMYERGEREPGFETMEAIADLFNVDMNYLYGRTDVKIADPIVWDTDSSLAQSPIPPGQGSKKAPGAKSGEVSEEEIKFALFGGGPVTDAQYEEVKQFVRFIKERDANAGKG